MIPCPGVKVFKTRTLSLNLPHNSYELLWTFVGNLAEKAAILTSKSLNRIYVAQIAHNYVAESGLDPVMEMVIVK